MSPTTRRFACGLLALIASGCNCAEQKATHKLEALFEIHEFDEGANPPIGALLADDAVIDFGGVKVDRVAKRSIALQNLGDFMLNVQEPKLAKGVDFAITRSLAPCAGNSADPHAIETGGCRQVTISVKASALADYEDTLLLVTDDPKRAEVSLKLTAKGSRGALEVCIASTPTGNDDGAPLDKCTTADARELPMALGALSLGGGSVRRRVQITNRGPVDLIVDSMKPSPGDPADFSVDPVGFRMILAKDDQAEARILFKPTAIGPRTGTIVVSADDPATAPVLIKLTAQGDGPKLCIDPPALDFGSVPVGSTSETKVVSLKSCGTKPVTITAPALEGNPDFVFVGTPPAGRDLAAGQEFALAVQFKPQSVGPKNARLKAASNDPASPMQFALLTGNAIPQSICKLEASAASIDFGLAVQGTQVTRVLTLHNAGNADCTLTSAAIDALGNSARFFISSSPPPPFVLHANALQAVELGYAPLDAAPPDNGTLTFKSDDPTLPSGVLTVALTGTPAATPECRLDVTPVATGSRRNMNFGVVAIGDKKKLTMTLKNVGSLDCAVQKPTFGSTFPLLPPDSSFTFGTHTPTLPSTLKPGALQTIEVVFSPTSTTGQIPMQSNFLMVQTGDNKASECGATSAARGCKQVFLAGTGVVLAIDTVPNALDFGLVTVGCNSVDKVVTIYNVGGAAVTLKDFAIDPATAPFTIVQKPAVPFKLSPGNSATVTVHYRPASPATDTAMLVISHDFSSGETTVALKGTGTTEAHQVDTFQQNTDPKTDVLWVIDNSGSMSDKQAFLGQNARTFIQQANATRNDYQVAVIAAEWSGTADSGFPHKADGASAYPGTNINPGEFFGKPQVIKRTDADPAGELEKNIKIGNCCADTAESGLEGAKAALSNPLVTDPTKPNSTFVRPDAKLSIIMLSDEEDQGASQSVQYYVDLFQQLKGAKNTQMFSLHAIAGDVPDGCSATVNGVSIAADAGKRYQEAVSRAGGIFKSICTADWGTIAKDIGLDAFTARVQFQLTRACNPATLKVKVNGVLQAAGTDFDYDSPSNSIIFKGTSTPTAGATITAEYDAACL